MFESDCISEFVSEILGCNRRLRLHNCVHGGLVEYVAMCARQEVDCNRIKELIKIS